MGTPDSAPDAAALFDTIILPGFYILAVVAVLLMLYTKYLEKKYNRKE